MRHWLAISIGILGSGCLTLVALAQSANFEPLTLTAAKPTGMVMGSTGGSTSLPAIVSNSDRNNNKCLGFGDPTPDHLLVLKQPLPKLRLRVDSNGGDTTLVVVGPDGIRCGDDTGSNKDASLTDVNWSPGTYRVWVGSATPGARRSYKLMARP
jgi:hypothetical protein